MVWKIGHRGAAGYEPENTLRSFAKAIELGVDMIEFDVQLCASGELVVIHDARVDRTTNGKGHVAELSFAQLRALDAGAGQKIPTLPEALDAINRKAKVNIEMKGEGASRKVFEVISSYVKEKNWDWDDFLVSSFNHYELIEFNQLTDRVKVGAIIAGIPLGYIEAAKKLNAVCLNPSKEFINKKLVDSAHDNGLKIFVFTINDPDEIRKMKELGVDGMFSNFPDRI